MPILSDIKKDFIIIVILLLAIFGIYKYHQSLKDAIKERDTTIVNLNLVIKDRDTTISKLESANKTLVEDVKTEKTLCTARVDNLRDFYEKEKKIAEENKNKRKNSNNKITDIKKDTSKTEDQKRLDILEIEYNILTGN